MKQIAVLIIVLCTLTISYGQDSNVEAKIFENLDIEFIFYKGLSRQKEVSYHLYGNNYDDIDKIGEARGAKEDILMTWDANDIPDNNPLFDALTESNKITVTKDNIKDFHIDGIQVGDIIVIENAPEETDFEKARVVKKTNIKDIKSNDTIDIKNLLKENDLEKASVIKKTNIKHLKDSTSLLNIKKGEIHPLLDGMSLKFFTRHEMKRKRYRYERDTKEDIKFREKLKTSEDLTTRWAQSNIDRGQAFNNAYEELENSIPSINTKATITVHPFLLKNVFPKTATCNIHNIFRKYIQNNTIVKDNLEFTIINQAPTPLQVPILTFDEMHVLINTEKTFLTTSYNSRHSIFPYYIKAHFGKIAKWNGKTIGKTILTGKLQKVIVYVQYYEDDKKYKISEVWVEAEYIKTH